MRKFFKFLTSRFFVFSLILLFEIGLIVAAVLFLRSFKELDNIIYLLSFIISVLTMLYIVSCRGNIAYTVSWLFFVGAIPVFGTIAYLIFGRKRFTKRKQKKIAPIVDSLNKIDYTTSTLGKIGEQNEDVKMMMSYVTNMSQIPPFANTEVNYYKLGDDVWPIMLNELKKAKHFIFIEYFIIAEGEMWNSILDILIKKAAEGVEVRLLYDDFGSISHLPSNYPKKLRKLGIQTIAYNKYKPIINVKMNNRDHRKIMVIDGHTGFTGGINLADEYVNKEVRFGHWKDNAIRLRGEAVWGLTNMFLSMWDFASESNTDFSKYKYENFSHELSLDNSPKGFVQPYSDIPYDYEPLAQTIYTQILLKAKKYVYITTPYLILSPELEYALTVTAKQGVEVVILVPHIPDKKLVFQVTKSYYRSLLESGVKIYEYTPGFIHSKMFISDDTIASVGTSNLDYRSMFLHFECGTICYNVDAINDMKKDFIETLSVSQEVPVSSIKNISIIKRLYWGFLKVFATLM